MGVILKPQAEAYTKQIHETLMSFLDFVTENEVYFRDSLYKHNCLDKKSMDKLGGIDRFLKDMKTVKKRLSHWSKFLIDESPYMVIADPPTLEWFKYKKH